jgi:UDP-GlcNAc:undecaprenyl-phosphate GlcNAc-1-phosphate transferase
VQERGLAQERTPLLGGLAILVGVLVGRGAVPARDERDARDPRRGGADHGGRRPSDDIRDLSPGVKLLGQAAAALICVLSGVRVDDFTFPFLGRVDLGDFGGPLTLPGPRRGHERRQLLRRDRRPRCGRLRDRGGRLRDHRLRPPRGRRGVLAACIAGSALGFLVHNFHPASVFMGDSGSNLLGCCSAR